MGLATLESNGYVFQVEMSYMTEHLGYKVVEIPIFFEDRRVGRSKMTNGVKFEAAWRTLEISWRHRRLQRVSSNSTRFWRTALDLHRRVPKLLGGPKPGGISVANMHFHRSLQPTDSFLTYAPTCQESQRPGRSDPAPGAADLVCTGCIGRQDPPAGG